MIQSIVNYHIIHLKFSISLQKILTMTRFFQIWNVLAKIANLTFPCSLEKNSRLAYLKLQSQYPLSPIWLIQCNQVDNTAHLSLTCLQTYVFFSRNLLLLKMWEYAKYNINKKIISKQRNEMLFFIFQTNFIILFV